MPILTSNDFSNDNDGVRNERCLHLQNNIDTYAAEIGCTGVHLAWAQGASAEWETARAATGIEEGEWHSVLVSFCILHSAFYIIIDVPIPKAHPLITPHHRALR